MLYKRRKENGKKFEALTLKNISIGLAVSIVGGFIFVYCSKLLVNPAGGGEVAVNPASPDNINAFDDSLNDAIRKPAIEASIASDFDNNDYEFFIYEKEKRINFNQENYNPDAFWLSQVKLGPPLEFKSEELKNNRHDQINRDQKMIEYDRAPKFTADGKNVVYCRKYRASASPSLYLMKIDATGKANPLKRITVVSNCSYSLTPDGKGIVYTRRPDGAAATRTAIYRMDLDSGKEDCLVETGSREYTNPIIVIIKNIADPSRSPEQRVYFTFVSGVGITYRVLNDTLTPSPLRDIISFNTRVVKLFPQPFDSLEGGGKFLVKISALLVLFDPTLQSYRELVNTNYVGTIYDAILDKDGTTIYYIYKGGYDSPRRRLIKNNIDATDPQELLDFPAESFSMRPKHA